MPHRLDTEVSAQGPVRASEGGLGQVIRELADKKLGCEVVRGAVRSNRVRLRMPAKYALSEVVGYLKGKSTLVPHDRHPEWRRGGWQGRDAVGARLLCEHGRPERGGRSSAIYRARKRGGSSAGPESPFRGAR